MILDRFKGNKEPESGILGLHFGSDRVYAVYIDPDSGDRTFYPENRDRLGWPLTAYFENDEIISSPTPDEIDTSGNLLSLRPFLTKNDNESEEFGLTASLSCLIKIKEELDDACEYWDGDTVVSMSSSFLSQEESIGNLRLNLLDRAGFDVVDCIPMSVATAIGLGHGKRAALPSPEYGTEELSLVSSAGGSTLEFAILSITYPNEYTLLNLGPDDSLGETTYVSQITKYVMETLEDEYGPGSSTNELIWECTDAFYALTTEPSAGYTISVPNGYETDVGTYDIEVSIAEDDILEVLMPCSLVLTQKLSSFLEETGRDDGALDSVVLSGQPNLNRAAYGAYINQFGTTVTTAGIKAMLNFESKETEGRAKGDVPIRLLGGLQVAALGAACYGTHDRIDVRTPR